LRGDLLALIYEAVVRTDRPDGDKRDDNDDNDAYRVPLKEGLLLRCLIGWFHEFEKLRFELPVNLMVMA
jgi:hypothetical protein